MNGLVELIKRIGIFMIAAQAVIHFAPGQKYEKYIRLIVGIIILLQFVMPLRGIFAGAETDWNRQIADMEKILEAEELTEEMTGASSVAESVINSLENEIKSRLNDEIMEEDYVVASVRVHMKTSDGNGEFSPETRQYELEKVRVAVYWRAVSGSSQDEGSTGSPIEKIQIEKINVGGLTDSGGAVPSEGMSGGGGADMDATEEVEERLRERFCIALGMDEEKMEVSVYGTNEKTDR